MKILIIDGHPYDKSFCRAIADQYEKSAKEAGHSVQRFSLRDKKFDLSLHAGYKVIQELEPDLVEAQKHLKDADHIVIVTPVWWGGPPALLKGFMDRTFLPGFAFKYRQGSRFWDKHMTGKTGRIIATSDAPGWWVRFVFGDSAVKMIKIATLKFVGVSPVGVTRLGEIKWKTDAGRAKMLAQIKKMGASAK